MPLELISSSQAPVVDGGRPPRPLRAPTVRPTERHEPWSISGVAIADLERAASDAGVELSVAVAVVVERRLLLDLLPEARRGEEWLDRRAAQVRARTALSAASAAYLRALTNGSRPRSEAAPAWTLGHVALPARLSDRLFAAWPPAPALRADELRPALLWERAAVLSGLTLTEWGLAEMLRR